MDRRATANETIRILRNGFYDINQKRIDIAKLHEDSVKDSEFISEEQSTALLEKYRKKVETATERKQNTNIPIEIYNQSTVQAILEACQRGEGNIGVLNFASAKNPGGGFLNGAMAQEESLAASSGLYDTLTKNEKYYRLNRVCSSMIYLDNAIYSPNVVFFRDQKFRLIDKPQMASVLTIPAVNMGQVLLKEEDIELAEYKMKERMKRILVIFAEKGCKTLILGAYGCGVFRNSPKKVAEWWRELLVEEQLQIFFEHIMFAVLDCSKKQETIGYFQQIWKENIL